MYIGFFAFIFFLFRFSSFNMFVNDLTVLHNSYKKNTDFKKNLFLEQTHICQTFCLGHFFLLWLIILLFLMLLFMVFFVFFNIKIWRRHLFFFLFKTTRRMLYPILFGKIHIKSIYTMLEDCSIWRTFV